VPARRNRNCFAVLSVLLLHFWQTIKELLPAWQSVRRRRSSMDAGKEAPHVVVWWMAPLCPRGPAQGSSACLCRKTRQEGKAHADARANCRAHHRGIVLGPGLVPEPGALQ